MNDTQLSYIAIQTCLVHMMDLITSRLFHDSAPSFEPHNGDEIIFLSNLVQYSSRMCTDLHDMLTALKGLEHEEQTLLVPVQTEK